MLPRRKPCQEISTQVTLPDASGYTWLFDSTEPRMISNVQNGVALGKTAGVRTVGSHRGGAKNLHIKLSASCATYGCSLVLYQLDGAGAWQLYTSIPLTAGAVPQNVDWSTMTPDVLIGFLASTNPPTAIATTCLLTEQP